MRWIRSPTWDLFWFLSGPAFGLLMVWSPMPFGLLLTILTAHTVSPIALAWSHRTYRAQVMRKNLLKFAGMPTAILLAGAVAAVVTWSLFPLFVPQNVILDQVNFNQLSVPLIIWVNLYAVWNLYHAGAQNFGFLSLYRGRGFTGTKRWLALGGCVLVTVILGFFLRRWVPLESVFLFVTGLVFINHWLAAIGLAAHVHGRHHGISPIWFVGGVLMFGFFSSWLYHVMLHWTVRAAVATLCMRASFGMWHFMQDRWVWKLSDPQVRATIGRDLRPA